MACILLLTLLDLFLVFAGKKKTAIALFWASLIAMLLLFFYHSTEPLQVLL